MNYPRLYWISLFMVTIIALAGGCATLPPAFVGLATPETVATAITAAQATVDAPVQATVPAEEPTVAAAEEATATPIEEPTATAIEEPTATPTEEPAATATEEPTATPAEEPTATPAEEQAATATEEPAAAPAPSGPAATINKPNANLRGGPSTSFPVVGTAKQGETFPIVGRNSVGDWFELSLDGEENVWASQIVVDVNSPIDAIPVSENIPELPTPAPTPTGSVAPPSAPPPAAPPTGGGPAQGRLLYSVANMDAQRWELWEYNFGSGANSKIADWRTEIDVSSDGSQIAYFAWPGDVGDKVGIWIMDSSFGNNRLLVGGGAYPSFNPGGDRLVLNGGEDIYIINSDGGGLRKLTRGEYAAWSPVNDEIVHRACVGGGCGLYVIDAYSSDANAKRRLTEGGSDGQPAWNPAGNRIAYISQDDGNFEIYVINSDGSNKVRVTNDPASDGLPVWSPDGQWIAFRSDRGGSWAIYVVRPDGSGLRKLIDANVLPRWFFEKMDWR